MNSRKTFSILLGLLLVVSQPFLRTVSVAKAVESEGSPENTLALCSDGIDNDWDESTDLEDSGCAAFIPQITIVKTVINDNGGTKQVADFPLIVTSSGATPEVTSMTSSVPKTFDPGSYVASETSDPNYSASAWTGDCDATGHLTLIIGDHKVCAITNNDNGSSTPNGGVSTGGSGGGGGSGLIPTPPTAPTPPANPTNSPNGQGSHPVSKPPVNPQTEPGEVLGATTTTDVLPCTPYLNEYIKFGANNNPEEVKKLQTFLNSYMGEKLEVNGVYNKATYKAVKKFQLKELGEVLKPWHIKSATGYVYKTTKRRINMIMCQQLNIPMPSLP